MIQQKASDEVRARTAWAAIFEALSAVLCAPMAAPAQDDWHEFHARCASIAREQIWPRLEPIIRTEEDRMTPDARLAARADDRAQGPAGLAYTAIYAATCPFAGMGGLDDGRWFAQRSLQVGGHS